MYFNLNRVYESVMAVKISVKLANESDFQSRNIFNLNVKCLQNVFHTLTVISPVNGWG